MPKKFGGLDHRNISLEASWWRYERDLATPSWRGDVPASASRCNVQKKSLKCRRFVQLMAALTPVHWRQGTEASLFTSKSCFTGVLVLL